MKKLDKKRDLEKKLVLKSETLHRLDLSAITGGKEEEPEAALLCSPLQICTFTYPGHN